MSRFGPATAAGGLGLLAVLQLTGPLLAAPAATWTPAGRERLEAPVEVPAAGWYRVALDSRMLLAAGSDDVAVLDPAGTPLPATLLVDEEPGLALPVAVSGVARSDDGGYQLTLDLGPQPPRHDRLEVAFPRFTVALGCRLFHRADREPWALLASADLFRLGADSDTDGGLARGTLRYPAVRSRWLRLDWPAAAGEPQLADLSARTATVDAPLVEVEVAHQLVPIALPQAHRLLLALPAGGERPLTLAVAIAGAPNVGARLWLARDGVWAPLPASRPRGDTGDRLLLALPAVGPDQGARPAVVRVDLYGASAPPSAVTATLGAATLVFRASAGGVHRLLAGPLVDTSRSRATPETGEAVRILVADAASERPPPPLPGTQTRPGAPLPAARLAARYTVEVSATLASGGVVSLGLHDEEDSQVFRDAGRLRLGVGDRQLPFLRQRAALPRRVLHHSGPPGTAPADRDGPSLRATSWWQLPAAELGPGPVALELLSQEGPFSREVTVLARLARPAAGAPSWTSLTTLDWRCAGGGTEPCQQAFSVTPAAEWLDLALAFHDGDNPPLERLTVEGWLSGEELRFVWPGEPVELRVAGAPLEPPRYDLALLADALAAHPAQPVGLRRLDLDTDRAARSRTMALAAVALAAVVLLVVLARLLPGRQSPAPGG